MAVYNEVGGGQSFIGKLKHDGDLLGELTKVCDENNIRLGWVQALGAVKKARIGFYDQTKREYDFFEIDKNWIKSR